MRKIDRHRDSYEIVAEILKAAIGGRLKTNVLLRARIDHDSIGYINFLVERGFLDSVRIKRKRKTVTEYKTTLKGIELMDRIESLEELCTRENQHI